MSIVKLIPHLTWVHTPTCWTKQFLLRIQLKVCFLFYFFCHFCIPVPCTAFIGFLGCVLMVITYSRFVIPCWALFKSEFELVLVLYLGLAVVNEKYVCWNEYRYTEYLFTTASFRWNSMSVVACPKPQLSLF